LEVSQRKCSLLRINPTISAVSITTKRVRDPKEATTRIA